MHINKKDLKLITYFLQILEMSSVEIGEDRREVLLSIIEELNTQTIDNRNFFHGSRRSDRGHRGRKLNEDGTPNIDRLIEERLGRKFLDKRLKDPMGVFEPPKRTYVP